MTTTTTESADLLALRELADDILASATESVLDVQQVGIPYDPKLWNTLTESGLTLLSTPESRGGSGAGLPELAVVLESSGYHAAPVPLAEHDLLAAWLLGVADIEVPPGAMTAAVTGQQLDAGQLVAAIDNVPWAGDADVIVVAGDGFVAAVPRDASTVEEYADIAGQPGGLLRINAHLEDGQYRAVGGALGHEFRLRGALARALQTCGALARAIEITSEHAKQREQFGRPIAKFQAVQALIASAAGALAVAKTAAQFATKIAATHGFGSVEGEFAVSVAKIESSRAATLVARNAHQVHGAIGFTLDHRLRHFTTPALAWRSEFGRQREWQHRLGRLALDSPLSVWELVTQLSSSVVSSDAKQL
jgi:acyl-CoA dehydrogenase